MIQPRETDVLNTDNIQCRTNSDAMKDEIMQLQAKQKDEIGHLIALLDKMTINNDNQIEQINAQSKEIAQLRNEVHFLKVSQWSRVT